MLGQKELRELALLAQTKLKENKSLPKPEMEKLWKALLPFVNKICFKKSFKNMNKDDLIQSSYEGLCSAVRKFDPEKNDNFFIYASNWIKAFIKAENKRNMSIFKLGTRNDRTMFQKISAISHLSIEQQAEYLNVFQKELETFIQAIRPIKGLLKSNSENNDDSGEEYLSTHLPNPEQLLELKYIYISIKEIFEDFLKEEVLSERDKAIIDLMCRVGAPDRGNFKKDEKDEEPQTYADIAEKFGMSRQAVQIAANKLKDKLRYKFKKNGIDDKAYHAFL